MKMSTCRLSCVGDYRWPSVRIRRVTTTRVGGLSSPPFHSFNLGDHVGDDPTVVAANRARLAATIGLAANRVVWMNQVHGDRVALIEQPSGVVVEGTDALVTGVSRLALAVVTADCVPVLMADADAGVVAAVHAGRVGAQRGVVVRAVETMLAAGAALRGISVLLGPAISGRNYEVPMAMADEVEASLPGSRTMTSAGTAGLDLRAGIACQLRSLGITAIDSDPRCTFTDPTLFSHRRAAPTGRLASLVWME